MLVASARISLKPSWTLGAIGARSARSVLCWSERAMAYTYGVHVRLVTAPAGLLACLRVLALAAQMIGAAWIMPLYAVDSTAWCLLDR